MYQENRRIDSNRCCSGEKSILSWFALSENRYYHDSLGWWIDTIMIRAWWKSILSWFAWVMNRYYHDSQISKRIDSNRIIKSMKTEEIDLNRFYQWGIDVNRFLCDIRRKVDPKQVIKTRGPNVLYCTCYMYGTVTYLLPCDTVPYRYRTVPYLQTKIYVPYRTVPYRTYT